MNKLDYYLNKFSHPDEQGSLQWLEGRKYAFGGSEMASVLNKDPHSKWDALMERKFTKENYEDDCTAWGKMFEPVAKKLLEQTKNIKIWDFYSIPHCLYPVCYSPDGLFVENEDLILLEIKSPIYRGVNNIPLPYLEQVKTGMCCISVKHCLFAQFRFRRCEIWNNVTSASYDRQYHKEYPKRCPDKEPLHFGYLYWPGSNPLVDLASIPQITKEKPKGRPEIIIDKMFQPNTGHVLMWKLFDVSYNEIVPDSNYLKEKETLLWNKYKELRTFIKQKEKEKENEKENEKDKQP